MAARNPIDDRLRFLAPFDPVVWDRWRFQLFWGWEYKLEAYVTGSQAPHGLLRYGHAMGDKYWAGPNLKVVDGRLHHELRFTALQNPLCYPRR